MGSYDASIPQEGSKLIKLLSESFIKPKPELLPDDHVSKKQPQYYLGPIDLAMLSLDHIQKGLLFQYSKPKELDVPSFLDRLKLSLSLSLLHFYPLAGRLATDKYPDEHASWIYVDCTKGPGARLLHASVDLTVSDILSSTDVHPIVRSFFDLGEKAVNYDGHTRPLLSIQVTELLDGWCIGFTMSHTVGDGTSLWHFVSSLSEIFLKLSAQELYHDDINFNSITISNKPIFGPVFPEGYGPILKLPYLEPSEFVVRFEPGPLRERIFHFSSDSIAKLKAKAQSEAQLNEISSFQALCGLLWRSVTKARNLGPDENVFCSLAANTRSRFDPPYSQYHFGNFIAGAQATCKVGEILGQDLGWAATLVHRGVTGQNINGVRRFLESYVKAPFVGHNGPGAPLYKPNDLVIAGSAKSDAYGPEFGLGRAVASIPAGYANKVDGKVTATPGREGGGSVELEVSLNPTTMNALELDDEFMSFVSTSTAD